MSDRNRDRQRSKRGPCGLGITCGLLASSFLQIACGTAVSGPADVRPDVALIVIDTLRNDEMDWAGAGPAFAPNLARLAKEGVSFPRTYAPCSWTKPSTATILSGLDPYRHGVLGNLDMMSPDVETIAEVFSAAGYETAAIVANRALYDPGVRQGFDSFQEVGQWIDHSSDMVGHFARQAVGRAAGDRPLFIYIHFLDPHDRYIPPVEDRLFLPRRYAPELRDVLTGNMRAFEGDTLVREEVPPDFNPSPVPLPSSDLAYLHGLYRGELHAVDRQVASILEAQSLRRARPLLTAVTSDHGESFYEHGMYRHGWTLHEEVIRVPLLFHGPALEGRGLDGSRIARSADIMPTLLDLAGLDPVPGIDGLSLLDPPPEGGPVLNGLTRYHVQKLDYLIEDPWKLIIDGRFGQHELYDLSSDPGEHHNLADARPDLVRAMLDRENALREDLQSRSIASGKMEGEQIEQIEDAMRALGYMK